MIDAVFEDGEHETYADKPFGKGGVGAAYFSADAQRCHVLKVFPPFPSKSDEQRMHRILKKVTGEYNIVQGQPYWNRLFAWPDKILVRFGNEHRIGVRMARVPLAQLDRPFEWFPWHYAQLTPVERGWWIARVAIAMKLARALSYLESRTLAHTDISPMNVFGDMFTGEMVLIDCDGVVSPGTDLQAQVIGTPGFQAPELLSNGKEHAPDRYTDRHALAVMIYGLLLYRHPLEGTKRPPHASQMSPEEEDSYKYAQGAVFIEHPTDRSNLPVGHVIPCATLGDEMVELFHRAFIDGLKNPGSRPYAREWEEALTHLYDRVVPCINPKCVQRFFAAPVSGSDVRCPMCRCELRGPDTVPYLRLLHFDSKKYRNESKYPYVVVGWPNRTIHAWHLATNVKPVPGNQGIYDPRPVARFVYDQKDERWYLENLGMDRLLAIVDDELTLIPRGEFLRLVDGLRMWLSGAKESRLAQIEMHPLQPGDTIYELPNLHAESSEPWPTFRPQQNDITWNVREPISLRQHKFSVDATVPLENVTLVDPPPENPPMRLYRFLILIASLVLGAWAGVSGEQLATFWIMPVHVFILLGALAIAWLSKRYGGWEKAIWIWGIIVVGLFVQGILLASRDPLRLIIGAGCGIFIGLLIRPPKYTPDPL